MKKVHVFGSKKEDIVIIDKKVNSMWNELSMEMYCKTPPLSNTICLLLLHFHLLPAKNSWCELLQKKDRPIFQHWMPFGQIPPPPKKSNFWKNKVFCCQKLGFCPLPLKTSIDWLTRYWTVESSKKDLFAKFQF